MIKWLTYLTALIGLMGCSSHQDELHIFTWSDYIHPDIIEQFEKEANCRVVIDTFDSNESMYAKLKLGGISYDLIFPSNYFVQIMQKQGMLQPIPYHEIPNLKYIEPQYLSPEEYYVPFMLSLSGLAYRKDKVKDFNPSWGMFGREDLKGRMTMLNDIREAMGAALKYLGYSLNTIDKKQIEEAADLLIKWKNNLAKFENEQYKNGIASAEYLVVQGYNGDILQVMQENEEVDFAYPKEGSAISIDMIVIPKNAHHIELAKKFINFMCKPEIAAINIAHTLFLSPNTGAFELLDPILRNNPALFPSKEILEKSEMIEDLGKEGELYNRAWDRVKTQFAH